MRRNQLDEMQLQKRNKIGNQSFFLLFYLLMIDIGAYSFGFRWLKYPTNVFVIMLLCMSYFLIRTIWSNSYVGPNTQNKSIGKKAVFIVAAACFVSGLIIFIYKGCITKTHRSNIDDNGAMILFIISTVALLIALVVNVISKKQNDNDE